LSYVGTNDKSVLALKEAYHQLGASYYFEAQEESFTMYISGVEENLEQVLKLTQNFILDLEADETKVKKTLEEIEATNKINRREASYVSGSLNEYVLYGKNSPRLRELTKKQSKQLTGEQLINTFKRVTEYETTVNYVGNSTSAASLISKYLSIHDSLLTKQKL